MIRTKVFLLFLSLEFFVFFALVFYIKYNDTQKRQIYSFAIKMTDLSVATRSKCIRDRSLSSVYCAFDTDPISRDFMLSAFIYAPSNIQKINPSRITYAK